MIQGLRCRVALFVLRAFTWLVRPLIASHCYVELMMIRAALHWGLHQDGAAAAVLARALMIAHPFERGWPGAPELYSAAGRAYARLGWDRLAADCHAHAWNLSRDLFSEDYFRAYVAVEAPASLLADEALRTIEGQDKWPA